MNAEEATKKLDELKKALLEAAIEVHEAKIEQLTEAELTPETAQKVEQFGRRIETFRGDLSFSQNPPRSVSLSPDEVETFIERLKQKVVRAEGS